MKIDSQDIIRTAQQLCDEENKQLHVRPWNRSRHFHVPVWLVALPAAAIVGFVLGLWTKAKTQDDMSVTALVDTVYIKVPAAPATPDTALRVCQPQTAVVATRHKKPSATARSSRSVTTGRPVADDKIRYDLLVRN